MSLPPHYQTQPDPCTKRWVWRETQTPNPLCETTATPIERPFIASQACSQQQVTQDPLSDILENQSEDEAS